MARSLVEQAIRRIGRQDARRWRYRLQRLTRTRRRYAGTRGGAPQARSALRSPGVRPRTTYGPGATA